MILDNALLFINKTISNEFSTKLIKSLNIQYDIISLNNINTQNINIFSQGIGPYVLINNKGFFDLRSHKFGGPSKLGYSHPLILKWKIVKENLSIIINKFNEKEEKDKNQELLNILKIKYPMFIPDKITYNDLSDILFYQSYLNYFLLAPILEDYGQSSKISQLMYEMIESKKIFFDSNKNLLTIKKDESIDMSQFNQNGIACCEDANNFLLYFPFSLSYEQVKIIFKQLQYITKEE